MAHRFTVYVVSVQLSQDYTGQNECWVGYWVEHHHSIDVTILVALKADTASDLWCKRFPEALLGILVPVDGQIF